MIKSLTL